MTIEEKAKLRDCMFDWVEVSNDANMDFEGIGEYAYGLYYSTKSKDDFLNDILRDMSDTDFDDDTCKKPLQIYNSEKITCIFYGYKEGRKQLGDTLFYDKKSDD